ncbi:DoxX family protein [Pseudohongiella acticola]|jgi:putative oxidoreductase|uniref:DoxX family protein n=1 Tax=Pseudohongiella acticola TaxID=1524254 RepID=UPI0009F2596E|nr:DoxX family protein [Pseudohongiella acticola]
MIPDPLSRLFIPASRIILAIYFFLPGMMKFTQYDMHVDYMASHGMFWIPFFLILSGLIQVGGSAALLVGYRVPLVAFVLAGLTFVISLVMHDFWTMEAGLQQSHETQNFFKNMGIMAGLLALSGAGAGAFSLDNRKARA